MFNLRKNNMPAIEGRELGKWRISRLKLKLSRIYLTLGRHLCSKSIPDLLQIRLMRGLQKH